MTWICLLEIEHELLATIADEELTLLKRITNSSSQVLWLTGTDILGNPNPGLVLSGGLSRALALEQPSLRFCVLDVGRVETSAAWLQRTCHNVVQAMTPRHQADDKEFVQKGSLMYINRFRPEPNLNSAFRHRIGDEFTWRMKISDAATARLAIAQPGLNDSIYFQQPDAPCTPSPPAGFVDVVVKAVSLNAKDVYALAGRAETRGGTTMLEFGGVVAAAGPDCDVKPADRVLVAQASHFGTRARVPARAVFKMLPDEEFAAMATLPTAYCTALYALHDRANLRKGESVLVHAGTGALGMAVIAIAQRLGATVYSTASTPAKKRFLTHELGVEAAHVFHSRDDSFVAGVLEATGGRGVDVVVNSLTGDLLQAGWTRCLANFGRFVEVGKRDLLDAGKLDMDVFLRNATFTAFDLTELACSDQPFYQEVVFR